MCHSSFIFLRRGKSSIHDFKDVGGFDRNFISSLHIYFRCNNSTKINSFRECVKFCIIAGARPCIIHVGRQGFRWVNPEIPIIKGWIIEVLLYNHTVTLGFPLTKTELYNKTPFPKNV